jgi:hypothetical protein
MLRAAPWTALHCSRAASPGSNHDEPVNRKWKARGFRGRCTGALLSLANRAPRLIIRNETS